MEISPDATVLYDWRGLQLNATVVFTWVVMALLVIGSWAITARLSEGETVSFGTHSFEVLHCPGHAPGHVVFYNREANFAHVGDVLFHGSIGRTDLPGGDHAALIRSIKEKLLPLGDDVGFICGHGPGGRFGEERRSNPFLV